MNDGEPWNNGLSQEISKAGGAVWESAAWRFRNKSLGREAPYDWLLSNLSVIVVADRMLDSQTLPNKRNFWKSFYDYSKFSPSFVGDMVVFYLVHMIKD